MSRVTRRSLFTSAAGGAALVALPRTATAAPGVDFGKQLDFAASRVGALAPVRGYPETTEFEKWLYSSDGSWIGGFWPGQLWISHLHTGQHRFREYAEKSALGLAPRRTDDSTHDLGFLFYPSWVTAWRITGRKSWADGALKAADTLTKRYNPRGRFIRAWGDLGTPDRAGWAIVDTMMNLDLLLFATERTGNRRYADIAVAHADTTAEHIVRDDGSTCHVFEFDPVTGEPLRQRTHQGYSPTSCWSRGQSWAVYGFTTLYRRTQHRRFLDVASRAADYLLSVLTPDRVPVWDYRSPYAPHDIKDSSAGAVAACGLLDLAAVTGQRRYRDAATSILAAVALTCGTGASDRAEAVLGRATSSRPDELGIEVSLPYGDYYFAEALLRLVHPEAARKYLATA